MSRRRPFYLERNPRASLLNTTNHRLATKCACQCHVDGGSTVNRLGLTTQEENTGSKFAHKISSKPSTKRLSSEILSSGK
eukprot:525633-Pyramimonas_sp.AAC.3